MNFYKLFKNPKKTFRTFLLLGGLINLIFYLIIFDIPWFSDDYPLVFGLKLFNLINDKFLTFDTGYVLNGRFVPFYTFIYQLLPADYRIFHFVVTIFYFCSSIFLYLIINLIIQNNKIAFLSSLLFLIHYGLTIKPLIWIAFYGHIMNCFFGFASIYFFLHYIKNNKLSLLIVSISLSLIGSLIMESGLIYPILLFLLVFLFKNRSLKNLFLSISPILIYFCLSFIFDNSAIKMIKARTGNTNTNKTLNIIQDEKLSGQDNELYWYRSTYAPRDFKGYSLKLFDNILNSINLSPLEKIIKTLDKTNKFKTFIKTNISILLFLFISIFLFYIFIILKRLKEKKIYFKMMIIYLSILLIYSILFFRKDFSIALSFPSVIILSKVFFDLLKLKSKNLAFLTLFLFIFPSAVFAFTKFNNFSTHGSIENIKATYNSYYIETVLHNSKNILIAPGDFRYFYFYKNFDKEKQDLKKYIGLSSINFKEKISNYNY